MTLQRVQLRLQISQIPQANGLVCRSSGQNSLCRRIEGDRVDRIAVLTGRRGGSLSRVRSADIQDLKGDIIGDGADEGRVKRVVLDIIDDRRMVGIGASRTNGFVALGVGGKVPLFHISIHPYVDHFQILTRDGQSYLHCQWRGGRPREGSSSGQILQLRVPGAPFGGSLFQ